MSPWVANHRTDADWVGVMPHREIFFSLAIVASMVADLVSRLLYRRSTTVMEGLSPIKAAITTTDAGLRLFLDKSSDATGSVPLSFLMGRGNPSR